MREFIMRRQTSICKNEARGGLMGGKLSSSSSSLSILLSITVSVKFARSFLMKLTGRIGETWYKKEIRVRIRGVREKREFKI